MEYTALWDFSLFLLLGEKDRIFKGKKKKIKAKKIQRWLGLELVQVNIISNDLTSFIFSSKML